MSERDGIAIVGISCRIPGAEGPEALWSLLCDGVEAIGAAAPERNLGIERGGFIDGVDAFDADFFRISPREAAAMDPQQRLALELGWEAIEDAAFVPGSGAAQVAVFLGAMGADYGHVLATAGRGAVSHHTMAGQGRALIANRVSYALGFSGPSLTVDTGQSSSLVAVHLACESLHNDECAVALAGGVNLILSPLSSQATIEFGALSPDGRCYAWDERANGHVRGEGGGIVVLKRLADAVAAGDRIYGVIRGSALATGSGDGGLTMPSAAAQRRTIGAALARSGVAAADVQYVELHGTGTPVGDPIEAAALADAYGRRHGGERLAVGSVKTNVGHLEGSAGITGLIKATLCVHHRRLVASLNFSRPNPKIPLGELGLRVVDRTEPWPEGGEPRLAGVSSFGMGGANCHVVLEGAPAVRPPARTAAPELVPVLVSARDRDGLWAQAARLRAHVGERPELALADLGWSLASGRTHLSQRAAVLARDHDELAAGLDALAAGELSEHLLEGATGSGQAVFVFPGQGSQWELMALELYESSPVFADALRACEHALAPYVDWALTELIAGHGPGLERVDVIQPALFSVMVSLATLWRAHGVEPSAVIGHSQGEIAAAHIAGALTLADAAHIVALRSQAVARELAGCGGMASIALDAQTLDTRLALYGDRLSVAAINGPRAAIIAGEHNAIDHLLGELSAEGVWARRIPVDYPSHSPAVERLREHLLADLADLRPMSSTVPFYSTTTGERLDTAQLDAAYWYRNLREPVRFATAVRALIEDGAGLFIEASPHPVLTVAVAETVEHAGATAGTIGTLRRGDGGPERFAAALADAHVHGALVDWTTLFSGARRVALPTYAFQRGRYWLPAAAGATGDVRAAGLEPVEHPLLAAGIRLAHSDQWLFTGRLTETAQPWLADSAVPEIPAGALLELALECGRRVGAGTLEDFVLEAPLCAPADVQVMIGDPRDDGRRPLTLHGREGDGPWTCVATGALHNMPVADVPAQPWPPQGAEPVDVEELYEGLAERGLNYGAAFQCVVAAWRRGEERFAELAVDDDHGFGLHPVLLDAALQLDLDQAGACVPSGLRGVHLLHPGAPVLRVQTEPRRAGGIRIAAHDEQGAPVLAIDAVELRRLEPDALFDVRWVEVPLRAAPPGAGQTTVIASGDLDVDALPERAVVITRGAVSARAGDAPDLDPAFIWGRLQGVQAQHPGRFVLLDTDGDTDAARYAAVAACGEPQLALRGGRAYAPRLARVPSPPRMAPPLTGCVLLSGAAEPVGAAVARRLATRRGIRRLLFVDAPDALVAELAELGCTATTVAERDLAAAIAADPPRVVIHAAAELHPAPLLDALTETLDAFVLFSSAAARLGSPEDGELAGASAALDALADRRRARGLPAQVLAWSRWPEHDDALEAWLDLALASGAPRLLPLRLDPAAIPDSALFSGLRRTGRLGERSFARHLAALPETERRAFVLDIVREHAAAVLARAVPHAIEPARRFKELGFDSVTAVALRNRLAKVTGLALPTTLIFDYPSCAAVTGAVLHGFAAGEANPAEQTPGADDDERTAEIDAMDVDELIRMT